MEEEKWKSIKGYEGGYEVSNLGRVRQIKILKTDGGGHAYSRVNIDGNTKYVHRLVAFAFLGEPPNPEAVINHKDFNRRNNRVENLEWVTQKENVTYSKHRLRKQKEKCKKSNTGYKYITHTRGKYQVQIKQLGIKKEFKCLEDGVKYRDEVMKKWRENVSFADEMGRGTH